MTGLRDLLSIERGSARTWSASKLGVESNIAVSKLVSWWGRNAPGAGKNLRAGR